MEGNPPCEDEMACEHGAEARAHVAKLRQLTEERPAAG
jgi:hypothetical protein